MTSQDGGLLFRSAVASRYFVAFSVFRAKLMAVALLSYGLVIVPN